MKKIDELKAEIKKAEMELEGLKTYLGDKKNELKMLTRITDPKEGDYVEATNLQGERIIGQLIGIIGGYGSPGYKIKACSMETTLINIPIKKWQPQKGELCIFGDFGCESESVIEIFLKENNSEYPFESTMGAYEYCIPLLSEKQFKEHIGYEKC